MRTLPLLLLSLGFSSAYRPSDFIRDAHLTEDAFLKMQEKLSHLNDIQHEILGIPQPKRRPGSGKIALDEEIETRPEELPSLFEGDIILTDEQMDRMIENAEDQLWAQTPGNKKRARRALSSFLPLRWSASTPIQYFIDSATGIDVNAVLAGVNTWQNNTCLNFQRSFTPFLGNGFRFIAGPGCYSYIGKIGFTPQDVSIGHGCTRLGTVCHEIGHALGFYHEQSRYDRDNYIKVLTQNMASTSYSQFSKQDKSAMNDYGTGYDFGSMMHYDSSGFTINGGNTIETLDQNYQTTIGQRVGPSFIDVKEINLAYCDNVCPIKLACENGGYTDVKDCSKCRCPEGFGGTLCDRAANAAAACGVTELTAINTYQTIKAQGSLYCTYVITAPPGHKIHFEVIDSSFLRTSDTYCSENYFEIKYGNDLSRAGARYCNFYPTISLSETNKMVVIYVGNVDRYAFSRFGLKFRQDPLTPETTQAPVTKPPTTTTSTTTTTTTTTQSTTTSTTAKPTTTTRRVTTTRGGLNTHYPVTIPTTPTPGCSAWSPCTAQCGACGTTSRRCGATVQTQYCNFNACGNTICCAPFFLSQKGTCVRPYGDKKVVEKVLKKYTEEELAEARRERGGNGWFQEEN